MQLKVATGMGELLRLAELDRIDWKTRYATSNDQVTITNDSRTRAPPLTMALPHPYLTKPVSLPSLSNRMTTNRPKRNSKAPNKEPAPPRSLSQPTVTSSPPRNLSTAPTTARPTRKTRIPLLFILTF